MAEQRVDISGVEAGGDITIAPQQHNYGATGSDVRGWMEALQRGALERTDQVEAAARADEHRLSDRPSEAADGYLGIAAALDEAGYGPAARIFRERAAGALTDVHARRGEARTLRMRLAREAISDGTRRAESHARQACQLSTDEDRWEAGGLFARAKWPEHGPEDLPAIHAAWERTKGTDGELEWAAALVEQLHLTGDSVAALEVARDADARLPLGPGPRMDLRLDHLDALGSDVSAEALWHQTQAWAAGPSRPIPEAARFWQRRGVALTRAERGEEARDAFLMAVQTWSREPGFEDQVAQAYLSAEMSAQMVGTTSQLRLEDPGIALALTLRGSKPTATATVDRLDRRGLAHLLNEDHNNALRALGDAQRLSRRAGNLADWMRLTEELGDLWLACERSAVAVRCYVACGNPKKVHDAADGMSVDDLAAVVDVESPRWERTTSWAALTDGKALASPSIAAKLIMAALAEIDREAPWGFPTNAGYYAIQVLGNLVPEIPAAERLRAMDMLREAVRLQTGNSGKLAEPLFRATLLGISDETPALVDALLNAHNHVHIGVSDLAGLLEHRPDQYARVAAAAEAGHRPALEIVAYVGRAEPSPEILTHAISAVEAAAHAHPRRYGAEGEINLGMGGELADVGVYARWSNEELRGEFVDRMLEIAGDASLPVYIRTSVMTPLFNVVPAMTSAQARTAARVLVPIAAHDDEPTSIDRMGVDDKLARFTVDLVADNAMRAAALEVLGALAAAHAELQPVVEPLVAPALSSAQRVLVCAALETMARIPQLNPEGVDLRLWLVHEDPAIRINALAALQKRDPAGAEPFFIAMAHDPDPFVRRNLVTVIEWTADVHPALKVLEGDLDAYVRAQARAAARASEP